MTHHGANIGDLTTTLHSILAIDQYRDYLRTEFRANEPALKKALERELNQSLFLAQEPFYQAHRPSILAGTDNPDLDDSPAELVKVIRHAFDLPEA